MTVGQSMRRTVRPAIQRRIAVGMLGLGALVGLAGGPALAEPSAAGAGAPQNAPPRPVDATHPASKIQYSDTAMGTRVTVWLWTADERAAAQAAEAVFAEMKRLDLEMSNW